MNIKQSLIALQVPRMEKKLLYLGTSSARPSDVRSMTSICITRNEEILMFDVGEGTQHSFSKANLGWNKKMKIFVTHLHGDHIFGLLGLLHTMSMYDRTKPLEVFGPRGIDDFIVETQSILNLQLTFSLNVHVIQEGIVFENSSYLIRACSAVHTIPAFSYLYEEKGCNFNNFQNTKIGISGDTRPTKKLQDFFTDCKYLSFESTFLHKDKHKAIRYRHTTTKEAAKLAKNSNSANLILTHFSNENDRDRFVKEARTIHPSVIQANDHLEIPIV